MVTAKSSLERHYTLPNVNERKSLTNFMINIIQNRYARHYQEFIVLNSKQDAFASNQLLSFQKQIEIENSYTVSEARLSGFPSCSGSIM